MKVGIVAGEASGDYLGAGLMAALKRRFPCIEFSGIGGSRMTAEGLRNFYPMERISIIGLDDLLKSLADILRIRRLLFEHFVEERPALFIGVDVPDFNLGLEQRLRKQGIDTVHYVSPTVWAWRGYRIKKIKRAVSHMMTLFPFEAEFYRRHGVPVSFVGHPFADEIDPVYDKQEMQKQLDIDARGGQIIALLPGSRISELRRLGELFVQTAVSLTQKVQGLQFVAPFANQETMAHFSSLLRRHPGLPVHVVEGRSRHVLAAADLALVASGTAALEAALLKTPMVVTYKGSWVSYALAKLLAHVEHISMPNHLLPEPIVPEIVQSAATVENLTGQLTLYLQEPERCRAAAEAFGTIIASLRCKANENAANTVAEILAEQQTEGRLG